MSRLPLRIRLVAGFSAATFVVLLAAGAFVYWRVNYALDRGLDIELAHAAQTLGPLVRADGEVGNRAAAEATGVAWQVVAADGTVVDHGGPAGTSPLFSPRRLAQVADDPHSYNVGDFDLLPPASQPYRVRVVRSATSPGHFLLVGVRRNHRDEALRELLVQLTIAGLGALLITALVGERLARAALRPVERYRRRAAAIAAGSGDLRLDVPAVRDDEITRLGHTFNDMLSSLEEALDHERQFVSDASHELRTPVTLLTSRVQLALRRPRTQAEHERILSELKVDLDRLAALADQLLQVGRVDFGVRAGSGDLVAVIGRVVNQRRMADPARAADLSATVPSEPILVGLADFELERIVTNILDNAETHGAPPVGLTVGEPAPGWARLTVCDAGTGMPPALLDTATQRFARADDARQRPGAGLGLSLVQALVSQAGGELRLCHGGRHVARGHPSGVPCAHGPAMTVTVMLPTVRAAPADPAGS